MRKIFADTFYWVALASPRDNWHQRVKAVSHQLGPVRLVTTDEVLAEFLTQLGAKGTHLRVAAVRLVGGILENPNIRVVPQTRNSFRAGLKLYAARPDKGYSLTDCISMNTMQSEKIQEVLTNDRHFAQEGFQILFIDER